MKVKRKTDAGCGFKVDVIAAQDVMKKIIGEKKLIKLSIKCIAVAKKTYRKTNKKNSNTENYTYT